MSRKKHIKRIPTLNQIDASRRNGKASPGRPRIQIDWKRVDDLFEEGSSERDIAAALGIHVRTLQRRRVIRYAASKPDALGE
jgi:DNA invertase Pin-like site-specific DNA recombinase